MTPPQLDPMPEHSDWPEQGSGPDRGSRAMLFASIVYAIALAVSVVLFLVGTGSIGGRPRQSFETAGLIGMLLVLTISPAGLVLALWSSTAATVRLNQRVHELGAAVRRLAEFSALSDDARRVLNRRGERDLLRREIIADIDRGDWEAGLVLCGELADRFGYRADAEDFRARIEKARFYSLDAQVREGLAAVDGLLLQKRYEDAASEAARLARLHPDEARIAGLARTVSDARSGHKADLERRFLDAAQHDRIEEAMGLAKELDRFLTPAEAEALREVARGVVSKARENLGVKFKVAVREHEWATAAAIGRRIVSEFPNTKMATEVRGLLDGILARANAVPAPAET